jgi:exodeoxyribonuclease III
MRLATWNINGLRARLDFVKIWLDSRRPDLVGLQELKVSDDELPPDAFKDLGYQLASFGQKAWNGVGVLSREATEVVDRGLPDQTELGARLLKVRIGDLAFTTVYCPNGKDVTHEDFPRKLSWFDSLLAYWKARQVEEQAVLCGDFNVVHTALDTWRGDDAVGHIFHTDEERHRIIALLDAGLIDLYRLRHPERQAFSWWDHRGGAFHRGQGLRIDLMLGTPAVAARVKAIEIDRDFRKKQRGLIPSDHAPVYMDME